MKIKNTKAITFVEMMVATAIFTLVVGGLYATFMVGNRSWATYGNSVILQGEARRALMAMTKELREAKNILITKNPAGGIAINFNRPPVGVVSYAWNNTGNNANKIIRLNESHTRVLANHISSLSFSYLKNNAILIDITATRKPTIGQATNFNLKEKVALRAKTELYYKK